MQATEIATLLEERERRTLFEILFEPTQPPSWDEAESCLAALKRRRIEQEIGEVQREIEANAASPTLNSLLTKKQALLKQLAAGSQL
jgi:hypothetical protein